MPQCHNPKLAESKLMSVLTLTDSSRRSLEAIQRLDKKKEEFHLSIASRHHAIWNTRVQRVRHRLQDSLKKTEAYKAVVGHKTFSKVHDLNLDYTYKSMRREIHDTLQRMNPAFIRAQRTKVEIAKAKIAQQRVMDSNLETAKSSFRYEAIQEAIAQAKAAKERQEWEKMVLGSAKSLPPILSTSRSGVDSRASCQTEDGLVSGFVAKQLNYPSPDLLAPSRKGKRRGNLSTRLPPLGAIQDDEENVDSPR
ncbi:hypothetical protein CAPTEDRAFT_217125 [Capitella teleta]|uniref:Uncharacterized protein n=1 Tax=Capitella teleta TaxID=283909 RepID=R7VE41_CAPTE|nr:hypothetical protein CAPTEDRAFT_217125 [Capitella teleta]|eukprot:ELU17103.1 hypothetical protein CAPTEDRAFT_217125 [Capitella teleta]